MINKLWTSEFGDDYHERNKITEEDVTNRINLWKTIFGNIFVGTSGNIPNTIMEIGAGNGANLMAIRDMFEEGRMPPYELYGVEPNKKAREQLTQNMKGSNCSIWNAALPDVNMFSKNAMGLVYTYGVLIHIPKDELSLAMKNIYDLSNKFIVSIEYFSPEERKILYRGQENALWARDFGSLWLDNFPLRCIATGFFWKRTTGLDNVTAWIMEKVN